MRLAFLFPQLQGDLQEVQRSAEREVEREGESVKPCLQARRRHRLPFALSPPRASVF